MTDALAEWMLRRNEQNHRPADDIDQLLAESAPRGAFLDWVEERRDRHGLRNDDVTLMIIDLEEREGGSVNYGRRRGWDS